MTDRAIPKFCVRPGCFSPVFIGMSDEWLCYAHACESLLAIEAAKR